MKKTFDFLFCLLFVVLLALPLALSNFKTKQRSALDNAYLPELDWSEPMPIRERIASVENYLNKRIGFRAAALDLYVRLNDTLFGLMDHPIYMHGKDGYVFQNTTDYIKDYQHLNLNQPWAEHFASWMAAFSETAEAHGAHFLYTLIPDKKTVYAEYFPDGYNVRGTLSRTDQVLAELEKRNVWVFYALDTLLEAKQTMQVANEKYDAGHWNENGAYVYARAVIELLRAYRPEIPSLAPEEFTVGTAHKTSLQTSRYPIDEDVPTYTRRNTVSVDETPWLEATLTFPERKSYRTRFVNPEHPELPKLLVFHDSYLIYNEKFFLDHFSEITFIHRYNLVGPQIFEFYLELLQPDFVIYENPERSFEITFDPAR